MKEIEHDATLLKKLLTGEATPEEQKQALQLLDTPEMQKRYEELNLPEFEKRIHSGTLQYDCHKAYKKFQKATQSTHTHTSPKNWHTFIGIAASIAIVIGLWTLLPQTKKQTNATETASTLAPGQTKGRLTLADGRTMNIEPDDQMTLETKDATVSYQNGCLTYQNNKTLQKRLDQQEVKAYNQFFIPCGAENTINLSDGTRIHLNSDSRLIYPERFIGKQRIVFLEGEAYFDVAHDAERPFIVQTRMGDIQVLGTSFNVNIYPENTACYATLVKGKIAITVPGKDKVTLNPNEQAVITHQNITKKTVDVNDYAGWIKGFYIFKNKKLKEIMRTFERWYNIKVVYDDPSLSSITYTGSVKRHQSIRPFLEALQLTTDLRYYIQGREIHITK